MPSVVLDNAGNIIRNTSKQLPKIFQKHNTQEPARQGDSGSMSNDTSDKSKMFSDNVKFANMEPSYQINKTEKIKDPTKVDGLDNLPTYTPEPKQEEAPETSDTTTTTTNQSENENKEPSWFEKALNSALSSMQDNYYSASPEIVPEEVKAKMAEYNPIEGLVPTDTMTSEEIKYLEENAGLDSPATIAERVQAANKDVDQGNEEAKAPNGYDQDSLMGAWGAYNKEVLGHNNDFSIMDFATTATQDEWWNMMHDPRMQKYYQAVLDRLGDDREAYFNEFNGGIEALSDWDGMLKYIGKDADVINEAVNWLIDTSRAQSDELGNVSPLFDLDDVDYSTPTWTQNDDPTKIAEDLTNYGNVLKTLYLENAANNFYNNGLAGEAFTNAFTPEEIKKLTPLEKWDVLSDAASDDAGIYAPDAMNFHEIPENINNLATKANTDNMTEYGTPNNEMLPLINRASNGAYNYKWR